MSWEIKQRIVEGLGEKAMKTMADSLLSKGARTKTAPEKELAKNRSKVVRRVLYLLKLLKELFEHTLLDTEIPSPPPSPQ